MVHLRQQKNLQAVERRFSEFSDNQCQKIPNFLTQIVLSSVINETFFFTAITVDRAEDIFYQMLYKRR